MSDKKDHVWLLIQEHVSDTMTRLGIGSLVSEMSLPIKDYERKVHGMAWQLVENWCLCKYCQMFDSQNLNYNHWVKELKIYIDGLKYVNLKNGIDKRKPLKMALVDYFDLNDENMIFRMIRSKFKREGLFEVEDVKKVANSMANSIQGLIDAIGDDEIDSDEYLVNEFNLI